MAGQGAVSRAVIDLRELAEVGFTTVDLPSHEVLVELRRSFGGLDLPEGEEFFASCNVSDRQLARRVDAELKSIVGPLGATLLGDVEPFLASFVAKAPRAGSRMEFHQDLTYVDERHHRTIMIWIPLVDVDETSGALEVVAGSHLWSTDPRPGGTAPLPTAELQDRFRERSTVVPARTGQAVVFDNAIVHGSCPNLRNQVRPAAAVAFAPSGAALLHFHRFEGEPMTGHLVDETFFTTQPFRSRPTDRPSVTAWADALTAAALSAGLDDDRTTTNAADLGRARTVRSRGAEIAHAVRSRTTRAFRRRPNALDR